jgi:hypothetical protein
VSLIQFADKHTVLPTERVRVVSLRPKFVPDSVMRVAPEAGALSSESLVTTGALYVKNVAPVPKLLSVATEMGRSDPVPIAARQDSEVLDAHELVTHIVTPRNTDKVLSMLPKFNPETVTLAIPDVAVFAFVAPEMVGASYVKANA